MHAYGFADDTLGELFVDLFVDRVEAVVLRAREFERKFGGGPKSEEEGNGSQFFFSLSHELPIRSLRRKKQAP